MELNSKSIETDDSQKTSEDLGGQQSLSPTTPPASAEMLSSPDHADFLKSTEKNKEYEPETPEDIAKQVSFSGSSCIPRYSLASCRRGGRKMRRELFLHWPK